jgi:hypothetical protein
MVTNWYWRRIRTNLNKIVRTYRLVLPANRAAISEHLRFDRIDRVLAGMRGATEWDSVDWNSSDGTNFSKWRAYALGEEKKSKTILRLLSYNIDRDSTLQTVMRDGRLEAVCLNQFPSGHYIDSSSKHALPLLCLLLERVLLIMDIARHSLVSSTEFEVLRVSWDRVVDNMEIRATKLRGSVLWCL